MYLFKTGELVLNQSAAESFKTDFRTLRPHVPSSTIFKTINSPILYNIAMTSMTYCTVDSLHEPFSCGVELLLQNMSSLLLLSLRPADSDRHETRRHVPALPE